MSLRCYHGLPGGGKSYAALRDQVVEELLYGRRFIAFDFAIDIAELNAWFQETKKMDCPPDVVGRCFELTPEQAREFWRYPTPSLQIPNRIHAKDTIPDYSSYGDSNPVTPNGCGTLYVIDEAHLKFDARAWKTTGAGLTFYISQHRKLNDEIVMITQHLSQLESRVRNITELFIECTNTENRRVFSFFRRPSKLRQEWRYKCPPAPVDRSIEYKLDPALAKCYRTMSGFGVSGRNVPEKKRIRGIPMYYLAIPALILCYVMSKAPEWVAHSLSSAVRKIGKTETPVSVSAPSSASSQPLAPPALPSSTRLTTSDPVSVPSLNPAESSQWSPDDRSSRTRVWVLGWVVKGSRWNVVMSNGETWTETTPGMSYEEGASIQRNGLWKRGVFYPLKPIPSEPNSRPTAKSEPLSNKPEGEPNPGAERRGGPPYLVNTASNVTESPRIVKELDFSTPGLDAMMPTPSITVLPKK